MRLVVQRFCIWSICMQMFMCRLCAASDLDIKFLENKSWTLYLTDIQQGLDSSSKLMSIHTKVQEII